MKNKKTRKYLWLIILLLAVSIGYAALATTLKINGTTKINKNLWSVYWDNIDNEDGVTPTSGPTIGNDTVNGTNTKVTYTVDLNTPGDYYEFTVDAVNAGTLDAMVTAKTTTVSGSGTTLPPYIIHTVTYADGKEIENNHILKKKTNNTPTTEAYKVRVEFSRSITQEQLDAIPQAGLSYTIEFAVTYSQADENAVNRLGLIDSCVGCKFAHLPYQYYYSDNNEYSEERSTIVGDEEDLTKDFTTIKAYGYPNEQDRAFNGFTVDANNKITRGFACGVLDDKSFCIEGSTDGSTYTSNIAILDATFEAGSCYYNESETTYMCSANTVFDGVVDDGYVTAEASDDGRVEVVFANFYRCMAHAEGDMYCE